MCNIRNFVDMHSFPQEMQDMACGIFRRSCVQAAEGRNLEVNWAVAGAAQFEMLNMGSLGWPSGAHLFCASDSMGGGGGRIAPPFQVEVPLCQCLNLAHFGGAGFHGSIKEAAHECITH